MSKKSIDVFCVGMATWDFTMGLDYHPKADEKMFSNSFVQCGGGPAANAAYTVAKLGGTSAFSGYLGRDLYGKQHLDELKKVGVNSVGVIQGKAPTPVSCVLTKPGGKRTVVSFRANPPIKCSEHFMNKLLALKPRVFLFDGHERYLSMALAQYAKAHKISIILDAGSVHPGTIDLVEYADYLVVSQKFALDYTSTKKPSDALDKMDSMKRTVIITLGSDGLIWKRGKLQGKFPAFKVEAKDTTGAGDVFHGAFAFGLVNGFEFKKIIDFASRAAALCCTKIGARTGCPSQDELDNCLP